MYESVSSALLSEPSRVPNEALWAPIATGRLGSGCSWPKVETEVQYCIPEALSLLAVARSSAWTPLTGFPITTRGSQLQIQTKA